MQKKFISNLAFLILVNLLVKPFWILGIDREVQNILGSEVYGEYFVLFNFSILINIILDLGITNFNNRNIAQHNQLITKHFPTMIALKVLLGFVYLGVIVLGALLFGYSSYRTQLLLILALNQFLISFVLYLRSNIAALHFFKLDAILSVMDKILMIVFCAIIIWTTIFDIQLSIKSFVYAQTLSYLITAITAFIFIYPHTNLSQFKIKRVVLLAILKKSLPYAILILLMYFYHRMDAIMLDWMLEEGSFESGIYAQGYRLLDAFNMLTLLPVSILYPMFSKMLKDNEHIGKLVQLSFTMLFTITIVVSYVSNLYAHEMLSALYPDITSASPSIFRFLIFASIPIGIGYVFGTVLTANGNLQVLNIIAISGVVINFTLNYLLIPKSGAAGSALATLITQGVTVLAQVLVAIKIFKFSFNNRLFLRIMLFLLLMFILPMLINDLSVDWTIKAILNLILLPIIAVFIRLIDLRGIYRMVINDKA